MFLRRCQSTGVTFCPICMVNCITFMVRFTISVKPILLYKVAIINFLGVCNAPLTTRAGVQRSWTILYVNTPTFAKIFNVFGYECINTVWFYFLWESLHISWWNFPQIWWLLSLRLNYIFKLQAICFIDQLRQEWTVFRSSVDYLVYRKNQ